MKMGDLRKYLNTLHEMNPMNDDLVVAVVTNDVGMPARPHVVVRSAMQGFDWEAGRLMITVEKPIKKV